MVRGVVAAIMALCAVILAGVGVLHLNRNEIRAEAPRTTRRRPPRPRGLSNDRADKGAKQRRRSFLSAARR